jgi:hypothetical protein
MKDQVILDAEMACMDDLMKAARRTTTDALPTVPAGRVDGAPWNTPG